MTFERFPSIVRLRYHLLCSLTLKVPIPQNGQTHSNNSSANCRQIVWVFDYFVKLALKGLKVSRENNVKIGSTLFMTSLISTKQFDILFHFMSFFYPYVKRKFTTDIPLSLPAQKTMSHKSFPSIIKEDVPHFLITNTQQAALSASF